MRLIGLVAADPLLAPFAGLIEARLARRDAFLKPLEPLGGLLGEISQGHLFYGFQPLPDGGVVYREWAPGASALSLVGEFNGWNPDSHPLTRGEFGVWSLTLPPGVLPEGSRVKVHVESAIGPRDRIPAYARRVVQDPESKDFAAEVVVNYPLAPNNGRIVRGRLPIIGAGGNLRVYEAHPGMATEDERVGTWAEFAENVLPRIASLGYNAVQLMAVQEHPYYGSFGYHVSSLFAPSSRFGTPDDLRALVSRAHELGLAVVMDIVHSHAVKNWNEGLGHFDGTDHQYFHAGARGQHPAWDSLCWDYAQYETLRLLLSNVRYWQEEFGFDGFRFDGVTSMLYLDHGLGRDFGPYEEYFGGNIDEDAVRYLQLASDLARLINPAVILIAEDMSGMPGMARPTQEGGLGFTHRLAMGVPDFWIKTIKERPDEAWSLGEIWGTLLNRRWNEDHLGYAESHDQALVGDKTLAFLLMDAAMYTDMALDRHNPVVERGVALHKLIRLLTFGLAGEGWLSFMGNEFGHPEWIDFPREGNGWSYTHARRQWSLEGSPLLRYAGLSRFDAALMDLDREWGILGSRDIRQLYLDEARKVLVFSRGALVFAVNLHPTESYADLPVPMPKERDWTRVLCSDDTSFAGPGRVSGDGKHVWTPGAFGSPEVRLYLPSRSGLVLA